MFDFNYIQRMLLQLQSQLASASPLVRSLARIDSTDHYRIDCVSPQLAIDSITKTLLHVPDQPGFDPAVNVDASSSLMPCSFHSSASALPTLSAEPTVSPVDWPAPSSEEDCISYFFQLKWPHGFRCPRCNHPHAGVIATRRLPLYECRACYHQTSLIAGTVMESSRLPLLKWWTAMNLLASSNGVPATRLGEILQVSYKTALSMLKKLRLVIHRTSAQQPLSGAIQWGVKSYGTNYNQPFVLHPQEHPVLVAASFSHDFEPQQMNFSTFEQHVKAGDVPNHVRWWHLALVRLSAEEPMPTHVKLQVIPTHHLENKDLHRLSVHTWLPQQVGSPQHLRKIKLFRYAKHGELPRIFQRLKTWINRTFHGIGRTYLQLYLDEFCFRYNTRIRGESVLNTLASQCMRSCIDPI